MEREPSLDDRSIRSMPFFPGALPSAEAPSASTLSSFSWSSHDSGKSNASRLSPRPLVSTPSSGLSTSVASFERSEHINGQSFLPEGLPLADAVDRPLQGGIDSFFHDTDNGAAFAPHPNINLLQSYAALNGTSAERVEDFSFRGHPQGHLPIPIPQPRSRSVQGGPQASAESDRFNGPPQPPPDPLQELDNRLRRSNVMRNILDRLIQCEMVTKAIQGELGALHQKVNVLLERSAPRDQMPEFRDPFAVNPNPLQSKGSISGNPRGMMPPPLPMRDGPTRPDELAQVTARLNALTSSVGQLLALQTQQQLKANGGLTINPGQVGNPALENALKQHLPPNIPPNAAIGLGLPQRPDLRAGPLRGPNSLPSRTWSTGNLELTIGNNGPLMRHDSLFKGAKRGSVAVHPRLDSPGLLETPMEWPGSIPQAPPPREPSGSVKWDSLPIIPELLRSIARFGLSPPNKVQQRALPFLLKGSDVIAQAPPTQERIAAYSIPAINLALGLPNDKPFRGPLAVLISTTVDQATQAQRMIRDLGGSLGIRSSLAVGASGGGGNILQELRLLHHNLPHILCGTPQKLHALFTAPGGISGADVRLLVLDEVDQLIARNLQEFVYDIVKLLPPPRSRYKAPNANTITTTATTPPPLVSSPQDSSPEGLAGLPQSGFRSRGMPSSTSESVGTIGSVSATAGSGTNMSVNTAELVDSPDSSTDPSVARQTALFSNTVPQDVLNLANSIDLREPVRVLVRRDGSGGTEGGQGTRGLRQFYLYLAFTSGIRKDVVAPVEGGLGIIGSGRGTSNNAETAQAREWKLDALADLFEDLEVPQVVVHVGGLTALDNVVYKLANRGLDAIPLHAEMNGTARLAALNKFRGPPQPMLRPPTRILVVNEVSLKAPDVFQVPLIINYDLPKAVEEYAQRVAPAVSTNYSKAGVVVNFVTATGGDVEMLRSIECFYKIKCPEVPTSLRDLL